MPHPASSYRFASSASYLWGCHLTAVLDDHPVPLPDTCRYHTGPDFSWTVLVLWDCVPLYHKIRFGKSFFPFFGIMKIRLLTFINLLKALFWLSNFDYSFWNVSAILGKCRHPTSTKSNVILFYTRYIEDILIIYYSTITDPKLVIIQMNHIYKKLTFQPTYEINGEISCPHFMSLSKPGVFFQVCLVCGAHPI